VKLKNWVTDIFENQKKTILGCLQTRMLGVKFNDKIFCCYSLHITHTMYNRRFWTVLDRLINKSVITGST